MNLCRWCNREYLKTAKTKAAECRSCNRLAAPSRNGRCKCGCPILAKPSLHCPMCNPSCNGRISRIVVAVTEAGVELILPRVIKNGRVTVAGKYLPDTAIIGLENLPGLSGYVKGGKIKIISKGIKLPRVNAHKPRRGWCKTCGRLIKERQRADGSYYLTKTCRRKHCASIYRARNR